MSEMERKSNRSLRKDFSSEMEKEYPPNIQFIIDTNLFWSLFDCNRHRLIEDIEEIFKFNSEIDYKLPKVLVRELSGIHKSKIPYLQQHLTFEKEEISDVSIQPLIELNNSVKGSKPFNRDEKGDYKVIQTALKFNSEDIITIIVSNDEGIHRFVSELLPEKKLNVIWLSSFLEFLAKQAVEKTVRERFHSTSKMLKEQIETYRSKSDRELIPLRDIDKILVTSSVTEQIAEDYREDFDNLVYLNETTRELPVYLKKIGQKLNKIYGYIDLEEITLIEDELEKFEKYTFSLKSTDRDRIHSLVALHMISILSKMATLYDQKGEMSAVVSTLERAKVQLKYISTYKDKSQLFTLLSWVHLLNNSTQLSKFYYAKIEDFSLDIAEKLKALMALFNTPRIEIGEKNFSLLPLETWLQLQTIVKISLNSTLKEKINTLCEMYCVKPIGVFDVRHFSIKNEKISANHRLSFLQEESRILNKKILKKGCIKIRASNKKMGEIELQIPEIKSVKESIRGDVIIINDGTVERISRPRPGTKYNAAIYLAETQAPIEIEVLKQRKVI